MNITDTQPGAAPTPQAMNRREAVRRIALLMGGAMVGSQFILSGQAVPDKTITAGFTDDDRALLDEIGDTIVPATGIPGAKAVNIGAFMTMMVTDCYNDRQHAAFKEGLVNINDASKAKYGKSFIECSPVERTAVANALDAAQKDYHNKRRGEEEGKRANEIQRMEREEPPHYFRMMKELTVLGYFSSEIGCTQAVRYIEVPGSYNGNYPYKKGDMAFF